MARLQHTVIHVFGATFCLLLLEGQLPMHRSHDCPPTPPGAKHLASPVALANALSAYAKAEGVEGLHFDPVAMEMAVAMAMT